jgi:hypothetical protein
MEDLPNGFRRVFSWTEYCSPLDMPEGLERGYLFGGPIKALIMSPII